MLEAINQLLQAIRIAPIQSLATADTKQDAADAKFALDNASREIQLKGWEFNTEYDYVLSLEVGTGYAKVPNNTLSVRASRNYGTTKFTIRGNRLYNSTTHTYVWTEAPVVELVIALPYEDLPEAFKRYVIGKAAQMFCKPKLPSGATFQYTDQYLMEALRQAAEEDARQMDYDLTQTSPHFQKMRTRR